ncbi:hypothetical protein DFH29DRAFT_810274, partial [Suillus ampliporus]
PFYGHEQASWMCAHFITHLFTCPEYPPLSSNSQVKLPHFITYALHHTKLHASASMHPCTPILTVVVSPSESPSQKKMIHISAVLLCSPNSSMSVERPSWKKMTHIHQT